MSGKGFALNCQAMQAIEMIQIYHCVSSEKITFDSCSGRF